MRPTPLLLAASLLMPALAHADTIAALQLTPLRFCTASTGSGTPGGLAISAQVNADITQFGFVCPFVQSQETYSLYQTHNDSDWTNDTLIDSVTVSPCDGDVPANLSYTSVNWSLDGGENYVIRVAGN